MQGDGELFLQQPSSVDGAESEPDMERDRTVEDSVEDWVAQQELDDEIRSSLPAGLHVQAAMDDSVDEQVQAGLSLGIPQSVAGFIRVGDLMRSMRSEKPVSTPSTSASRSIVIPATPAEAGGPSHSEVLERRLQKLWRSIAAEQGSRRSLCYAARAIPGLRRVLRILETLLPFDHAVQLKRSEARDKLRLHFHGLHEDAVVRASRQRATARSRSDSEHATAKAETASGSRAGETPGAIYDSTHAFERKSKRAELLYSDDVEAEQALQKLVDQEDKAHKSLIRLPAVRRALRQRSQVCLKAAALLTAARRQRLIEEKEGTTAAREGDLALAQATSDEEQDHPLAAAVAAGSGSSHRSGTSAHGGGDSRHPRGARGPIEKQDKPTAQRPFQRSGSRNFLQWDGKRGRRGSMQGEMTPEMLAARLRKKRRQENEAFSIMEMQLRFCLCGTALIGDFATLQLLLSLEQESPRILAKALKAGKLAIPPAELPPGDRVTGTIDIVRFLAEHKGGSMLDSASGSTARLESSRRREAAASKGDSGVDADLLVCGPMHAAAAGGQSTVLDLLMGAGANVLVALSVEQPAGYYSPPKRKTKGTPLPSLHTQRAVIGEALPSQVAWLCSNVVAYNRLAEKEVSVRIGVVKQIDSAAQSDVKEAFERSMRPPVRPRRRMSLLDQVHASSVIMEGKDGGSTVESGSMAQSTDMLGLNASSSILGDTRKTVAKPAVAPLTMTGALSKLQSTQDLTKAQVGSRRKKSGMKHLLDSTVGAGQLVTSYVFDKSMPRSLQLLGIAGKLKAKRKPSRLQQATQAQVASMLSDGVFDKELGNYRQIGAPIGSGKGQTDAAELTELEEKKLRRAGVSGAAQGLQTGMPQTRSLPSLLRAIKTMRRLKADQDRASRGAEAMRAARQIELTMRANSLGGPRSSPMKLPKATAWESIVGEETYRVGAVTRAGQSPAHAAAGAQIFRAIRSQEQAKVQQSLRAARSTGQLPSATKDSSPSSSKARSSPTGSMGATASRPASPARRASENATTLMNGADSPVSRPPTRLGSPSKARYEDLETEIANPVAEQLVEDMDGIGAMGVLKGVSDDEEGVEVAARDAEAMYVALAAAPAEIEARDLRGIFGGGYGQRKRRRRKRKGAGGGKPKAGAKLGQADPIGSGAGQDKDGAADSSNRHQQAKHTTTVSDRAKKRAQYLKRKAKRAPPRGSGKVHAAKGGSAFLVSDTAGERTRQIKQIKQSTAMLKERLNQASDAAKAERVRIDHTGFNDGDERMRARARATETFMGKQWKATATKMGHTQPHRKGRVLHGRARFRRRSSVGDVKDIHMALEAQKRYGSDHSAVQNLADELGARDVLAHGPGGASPAGEVQGGTTRLKGTGTLKFGEGLPWDQWYGDSQTNSTLESQATRKFRAALNRESSVGETAPGADPAISRESDRTKGSSGTRDTAEDDELFSRTVHTRELMRSNSPVLDAALRDAERRRSKSPGLKTSRKSLLGAIGHQTAAQIISESQGRGSPFAADGATTTEPPQLSASPQPVQATSPVPVGAAAAGTGSAAALLSPTALQPGSDSEHELGRGATPVRRGESYEDARGVLRRVVATPVRGRALQKAEVIHAEGRVATQERAMAVRSGRQAIGGRQHADGSMRTADARYRGLSTRDSHRISSAHQDITDVQSSTGIRNGSRGSGIEQDSRIATGSSLGEYSAERLLRLQKQQDSQPEEMRIVGGDGLPKIVQNPAGRPVAHVVPLRSAKEYQMQARTGASITGVPPRATWDLKEVQGQRSRLLDALASVEGGRSSISSGSNHAAQSDAEAGKASYDRPRYHTGPLYHSAAASGAELGSGLGMTRRPIDPRLAETMPPSSQGEVRLHQASQSTHRSDQSLGRDASGAGMRDMLRGAGRPDIDTMQVRDPHRTRGSKYANEAAAARAKGEAYMSMFGSKQHQLQATPMRPQGHPRRTNGAPRSPPGRGAPQRGAVSPDAFWGQSVVRGRESAGSDTTGRSVAATPVRHRPGGTPQLQASNGAVGGVRPRPGRDAQDDLELEGRASTAAQRFYLSKDQRTQGQPGGRVATAPIEHAAGAIVSGDVTTTIILTDSAEDWDGTDALRDQQGRFAEGVPTASGPPVSTSPTQHGSPSRPVSEQSSPIGAGTTGESSLMLEARLPDGTTILVPARIIRKHATGESPKDSKNSDDASGSKAARSTGSKPESVATRASSLREILQQTGLELDQQSNPADGATTEAAKGQLADVAAEEEPSQGPPIASARSGQSPGSTNGTAMGLNMRPKSAITIVRVRPPTSGSVRSSRPRSRDSITSAKSSLLGGMAVVPRPGYSPRSSEDGSKPFDAANQSDLPPLVSPLEGAMQSLRRAMTPNGSSRKPSSRGSKARSFSQDMPPTARDDDSMAMDPPGAEVAKLQEENAGVRQEYKQTEEQEAQVKNPAVTSKGSDESSTGLQLLPDGGSEGDIGGIGTSADSLHWKQAGASFGGAIGFLNQSKDTFDSEQSPARTAGTSEVLAAAANAQRGAIAKEPASASATHAGRSPEYIAGSPSGGAQTAAGEHHDLQGPEVLFEIDLETGTGSWETLQVFRGELPAVVAKEFAARHNLPEKHVAVLRHVIENAMEKYDPAPVGRDRRPSGDVREAAQAAQQALSDGGKEVTSPRTPSSPKFRGNRKLSVGTSRPDAGGADESADRPSSGGMMDPVRKSRAVEVEIEVAEDDVRIVRIQRGQDLNEASRRFVQEEGLPEALAPRVASVLGAVLDGRVGSPAGTARTGDSRGTQRRRVSLVRGVDRATSRLRVPSSPSATGSSGTPITPHARTGTPQAIEVEIEVAEDDVRIVRIQRGQDLNETSRRFVQEEGLPEALAPRVASVLGAVLDGRVGSPAGTARTGDSRGTQRRRVSLVRGVPSS